MTSAFADDAIKDAVRDRYAEQAKRHLDSGGEPETQPFTVLSADEGMCCGPEGCGPIGSVSDEGSEQLEAIKALYEQPEVEGLPASVTEASLGCGNPTAIAELRAGETVLDLGSGGGIDCFLAAKQVGPEGRVIGVDMTDEMLALARRNAVEIGASNVEFRKGEIEALPVADASVDVLISNCVINLSTDKDRVLAEAYRALKPGGRFRVSDIVLTRELSIEDERYMREWSGCVAGALQRDDFAAKLGAAGFVDVRVELAGEAREGVHSATIRARKPE